MRHRIDGYKLGRLTQHRWALFRHLLVGPFRHEREAREGCHRLRLTPARAPRSTRRALVDPRTPAVPPERTSECRKRTLTPGLARPTLRRGHRRRDSADREGEMKTSKARVVA